ncbi:unnamed protein product [Linum tenue]|uniref:Uncharacterized protein n=1 Tax=Linum tenue TaxID=586396 RepID=A0AAV0LG70_9ROSI|nr:unnamed protein product [Linum tenue]
MGRGAGSQNQAGLRALTRDAAEAATDVVTGSQVQLGSDY